MTTAIIQNKTSITQAVPDLDVLPRVLLGITAVLAVIAVVPPLRMGAGLAIRGISLLSVVTQQENQKSDLLSTAIKAGRVFIVVLGIFGVIAASPLLMTVSLAVDIGVQGVQAVRAGHRKEYARMLTHISMIAIDVLAILGFVLGSWKFMVAATAVSAGLMLFCAIRSLAAKRPDSAMAFLTIAVASVANMALFSEWSRPVKTAVIVNSDKHLYIIVRDSKTGEVLAAGKYGENVTYNPEGRTEVTISYHSEYPKHLPITPDSIQVDVPQEVSHAALPPSEFPNAVPSLAVL